MKVFSIGLAILKEWRMINDRIAKRVYVEECLSCHLVVQPWKKWIDSVNDCLKKNLNVG